MPARKKKQAEHDFVFFTKDQVKTGTRLVHLGRLDPGSVWEVERIIGHEPQGDGSYRSQKREAVGKLGDDVYLKRVGRGKDNDRRVASFQYLSYSAIWRLR